MTTSQLVELHNNEPFADSALVARKVKISHRDLTRVIENVLEDYKDLREVSNHPKSIEKYYTEEQNYRGQSFIAYKMNRPFYTLVMMRLKTKKAKDCKGKANSYKR